MSGSEVADEIGEALRDFVRTRFDAFEQLTTLLFLREHSDRLWSMQALARALEIPLDIAIAAADHLARQGLVEITGREETACVRYGAASSALGEVVDRLAAIYEQSPVEVMKVMNARSLARVRGLMAEVVAGSAGSGGKRGG